MLPCLPPGQIKCLRQACEYISGWRWEEGEAGLVRKAHRLSGPLPAQSLDPFFFVCVFFAFQSTLGIGDWVGGKTQSNLLAHMHTHRPLRLDRPEMCTHTLPFWLEELQDSSHFIRAPCCRRVCRHLSVCGSMRVTVCLLIFEYVLMLIRLCVCVCVRVCVYTEGLWMGLIEAGPPCSGCASLVSTWVVLQPHHRPDGPSDSITHPSQHHQTTQQRSLSAPTVQAVIVLKEWCICTRLFSLQMVWRSAKKLDDTKTLWYWLLKKKESKKERRHEEREQGKQSVVREKDVKTERREERRAHRDKEEGRQDDTDK